MRAFIGLGGNLGEPAVAFRAAVAELRVIGQVVRVSSLYNSAPRGGPDQPRFLNAALELETDLEPADVLNRVNSSPLARRSLTPSPARLSTVASRSLTGSRRC